ncbi:glucose-6-phosphate isomerase family protein [uncultured Dubosiella sp.]|uniref:glucose-6-phosphate isomerase family protein n=1 Tax=uncultured Dubosiella sp. TaxID=1937011 RepID=UPI00262B0F6B|nr:glucose-6-phosphate isomerase family protein [uncultured Dubosiella sp.]
MEVKRSPIFHDFYAGLVSEQMETSTKLYGDAVSFYADKDPSLPADTLMYTVACINDPDRVEGHLNWGVSMLEPVCVCGECNMTRGHFHLDLNCQEYYWCAKGSGLLMLMDEKGKCWCEQMEPGTLHKIDGHHAHRLINTGEERLDVICVWNSNAGHDYARVEAMPFPVRVYKEDGEVIFKEGGNE